MVARDVAANRDATGDGRARRSAPATRRTPPRSSPAHGPSGARAGSHRDAARHSRPAKKYLALRY